MRSTMSKKRFNPTQCGIATKRNKSKKVDEEVQRNATRRSSARKTRNERNKVDEEIQCNAARQCKKKK